MQAAEKWDVVSVADYLAQERAGDVRHEYVGGIIYAMAGASRTHNRLSLNLATTLGAHLRGKPCQVFMADVQVRLESAGTAFYYPDVAVACDKRDTDPFFICYPKVLVEVLSPDTERTDRREKLWAYTGIKTLEEYVLVAQDKMEVTVFRRTKKWQQEVLVKPTQRLRLASLRFGLLLSAVYEGVKL
jgi:Uma2 family endonuclease